MFTDDRGDRRSARLGMKNFNHLQPMLLTERRIDFEEPGWLWEIQFDGYRLMAVCGEGPIKLRTRSGADATAWFPEVVKSLAKFRGGPCVLDGEICVLDQLGRSDFDAIRERVRKRGGIRVLRWQPIAFSTCLPCAASTCRRGHS